MIMTENKLIDLSIDFAVEVVNLCNSIKGNSALTNQLIRSGTSIGANIHEANYAHGKADFIAKLQIALKESYETEYWLELFSRTAIITSDQYLALKNKCGSIRRMLIASINTVKSNQ
jgi:four helix bundle protein